MVDRSYNILRKGKLFGMMGASSTEEAEQHLKEMSLLIGWNPHDYTIEERKISKLIHEKMTEESK